MRFRYRTLEQGGHRLHEMSDDEAGFRLVTDALGAEMVSVARRLSDGGWKGFLYRDGEIGEPTKGWKSHATVMGYFIHRLRNEQSVYEGDTIRGGNHSFLRHKRFDDPEVIISERGTLSFHLPASAIRPDEYPRRVSFRLDYALEGNEVEVTFGFRNEEPDRPAHVSFGLHPGFAVSSLDQARIVLPRGRYVRHLAPGNFLSGEVRPFESDGREPLPIKPFELPDSFLIEPSDVEDHVVRLRDGAGDREVAVDLSDAPYLTLWSDGGPFVCVEPCWGLPDHQQQEPFERKLGIQTVPAEGTLTKRCLFRFDG